MRLQNIEWLSRVPVSNESGVAVVARRRAALKAIATLEGAMILARSLGDDRIFDDVVVDLKIGPSTK